MSNPNWQESCESSGPERAPSTTHRDDPERTEIPGLLARGLLTLISFYRGMISPLLRPHCRFHPTCSSYAAQAIERYGPLGGAARALARLARCHPLNAGGYDPVR